MWFRNLSIFRLGDFQHTTAQLAEALAKFAFVPCSASTRSSTGWTDPREGYGLVHNVNGQLLIALRTDKKLLPASVISKATKARAAEIEEQTGRKPGRKQMREVKDEVTDELLAKAFTTTSVTRVWIDPTNNWLAVDTASATKAGDVVTALFKAIDGLGLRILRTNTSPVEAMTHWLSTGFPPAGFTVDQDAELSAAGGAAASIRFVGQTLEPQDVTPHIAAGKRCTRLALTWADRVSFLLTSTLQVRRVAALKVVTATPEPGDDEFDSDFLLMAGELSELLGDLVHALGDEMPADETGDIVNAEFVEKAHPARSIPAPSTTTDGEAYSDSLYDQAVQIVRANKRASISLVQRHLRIGYNRAARLLEMMESAGVVTAMDHGGTRDVLLAA